MTFANVGTLGVLPERRGELVELLTRRSDMLSELGCLLYEVGVSEDRPDAVFVVELWESAEHHAASLRHPEVGAAISTARPWLTGEGSGERFEVVGSPLRD